MSESLYVIIFTTLPFPSLLLTIISKIGGLNDIMKLTPMEILAILLATACHDVGHPGVNNKFLCATNDKTAIQVLGGSHLHASPSLPMHMYTTTQLSYLFLCLY